MVKTKKESSQNSPENQGLDDNPSKAIKIGPNTKFDTCQERLSPFGGLLPDFDTSYSHISRFYLKNHSVTGESRKQPCE